MIGVDFLLLFSIQEPWKLEQNPAGKTTSFMMPLKCLQTHLLFLQPNLYKSTVSFSIINNEFQN